MTWGGVYAYLIIGRYKDRVRFEMIQAWGLNRGTWEMEISVKGIIG